MRAELDALRQEVAELQASNLEREKEIAVIGRITKASAAALDVATKMLESIRRDWRDAKAETVELLAEFKRLNEDVKKLRNDGEDWKGDGT